MTQTDQGGQASVELALVLPLVALLALSLLQAALVARDSVLLSHATRAAARSAALEGGGGRSEAVRSGLDPARLQVVERREGRLITVEVVYRSATHMPLIGAMIPDVTLSDSLTIRAEPAIDSATRAKSATD